MRTTPWAIACFLCTALPGQTPPATPPTLEGRVLDVLGEPIPAAEVLVVGEGRAVGRASADGEGIYRLRLPGRGDMLEVRAAGKATVRLPWRGVVTQRARNIVLEDGASLRGRVLDADANPVAGASVVALVPGEDSITTRTDAQGTFAFEGLPLRYVELHAATAGHRGQATLQLTGDRTLDVTLDDPAGACTVLVEALPAAATAKACVRIFSCDIAAVRDGGFVPLTADGTATLQPVADCLVTVQVPGMQVEPPARYVTRGMRRVTFTVKGLATALPRETLGGAVRGLAGGTIGDVRLVARDRSQVELGETRAGREGGFAFQLVLPPERFCRVGLPLGDWLLVDDEMTIRDGFSWIPVTNVGERLDLLVERAARLRDVLKDRGGEKFVLAEVIVADSKTPWRELLRTTTDRAGNLDVSVPPGWIDLLAVTHDGLVCRASVQVGFGPTEGIAWQRIETGEVSGVLRDENGAPIPGVELHFGDANLRDRPDEDITQRRHARARTDREGRFRCRGLPAGDWVISTVEPSRMGTVDVKVAVAATTRIELAY